MNVTSAVSQPPVLTDPQSDEWSELNLAELFLRQARATPDACAIIASEGSISYGALARRVAAIDQLLRRHSITPEQAIGVLMQRSAEMVAVLLAVMHVGAAYVPLDPDDPVARNQRILAGSGCRLVLGDHASLTAMRTSIGSQPGDPALEYLEIDHLHAAASAMPACAPGGRRLAYILFTSGSTGEPKGVEIEHSSVVNVLFSARELMGFSRTDRYLAASTIGFDISVAEIFLPLMVGGSLLLRDRKIWLNPRHLAEDVRTFGVTVMQTGPSIWSVVLRDIPDFPKVRVAISTGEAVAPALSRRIAGVADQAWNLYGPTETTVWSTAHRLTIAPVPGETSSAISAPIGRPLAHTTLSIVDETGARLPSGERGELCIGGRGLARGYRGNDALTRQQFIRNGPAGERVYRTGDLVAWNAHGDLEYFGRNDDQLKIRSIRIEPREVEAAILAHPSVAQAAATWFDGVDSRSIVAAIVMRNGLRLAPTEMYRWLEPRLPSGMIPSRFVFPAALPLTPSGKVDRAAIRQSVLGGAQPADQVSTDPLPQLTQIEAVLVQVWQRLLKLKTVSVDDHFFSIGGDSLAAVKMITEVEAIFKISLPVQTAFEAPSPRRLAVRVEHANERSPDSYESNYIFPLAEVTGTRPLFFCNADLRLAVRDTWPMVCSLYSISHWAQGDGFRKVASIEDLARLHLPRIQTIQPTGPYRIAGFSFGGLVALEIVRQLRERGEEVELLLVLDPMAPLRTPSAPQGHALKGQITPLDESSWGRLVRHAGNLVRRPGGVPRYIWERLHWHVRNNPVKQWVRFKLMFLQRFRPNPVLQLIVPKNRWSDFWYTAQRMVARYMARPYTGPMVAVFTDRDERYQVWRELLDPQAEVRLVSCEHGALFTEPYLSHWLKPLEARLAGPGGKAGHGGKAGTGVGLERRDA